MSDQASRLAQLEDNVAKLQQSLTDYQSQPTSMPSAGLKIAETVAGDSAYPTTGNTFYIIFQDGSYVRQLGETTGTFLNRSSSAECLCYNISEEIPPEGSLIAVFERNGYWWTQWNTPS